VGSWLREYGLHSSIDGPGAGSGELEQVAVRISEVDTVAAAVPGVLFFDGDFTSATIGRLTCPSTFIIGTRPVRVGDKIHVMVQAAVGDPDGSLAQIILSGQTQETVDPMQPKVKSSKRIQQHLFGNYTP
jgi:hypothetical protein